MFKPYLSEWLVRKVLDENWGVLFIVGGIAYATLVLLR